MSSLNSTFCFNAVLFLYSVIKLVLTLSETQLNSERKNTHFLQCTVKYYWSDFIFLLEQKKPRKILNFFAAFISETNQNDVL